MNVREDGAAGKPDDPHQVATPSTERPKLALIEPVEFFRAMTIDVPNAVRGVVFPGPSGGLTDHEWCPVGQEFPQWAIGLILKRGGPAYMVMAAFIRDAVTRYSGRTTANAISVAGFWIDIEGSPKKYAKPGGPEAGYQNQAEVIKAVKAFIRATGLMPNFIVFTGSGGMHLHYLLTAPVSVAEWKGRAQALVKLASEQGLKIDSPVTTDTVRVMRAPGSLHQDTRKVVEAYRWRSERYKAEEWDALTGYTVTAELPAPVTPAARQRESFINDDVLGGHAPFSYKLAAKHCGAMRKAAGNNGRDTPYPVWILALGAAKKSVEGKAFAHEISKGYDTYNEAETNMNLDSLNGGPASCTAWRNAFGVGGPCDSCEIGEY